MCAGLTVTANARSPTVSSRPFASATLAVGLKPVSSIVPVASPSSKVTFIGFERVTAKFSLSSSRPSSAMLTEIVAEVSPGANVSVPDFSV